MLTRPAYLGWALAHYGKVPFDLASSGMPTLRQSELGAASLDDPNGWEILQGAIAKHNAVTRSEAIGALGASHGLWLAYTSMIDAGDDVLVEDPAYEPLCHAARAAGGNVVRFDRGPDVNYALDPERVRAAMTPRTKVVAISNLHNPSGARASDDAMREVAKVVADRGGYLFVDEVYAPFDDLVDEAGIFHGSARRLAPNVVATASLTKAYGLGPQRIGWVLGPPKVIDAAMDAIVASVGVLPIAWMHRSALALSHVGALSARSRSLLGKKRERVARWMREQENLAWSAPPAGLFGFATLRRSAADLRPVIERGIEAHGVIVAPGSFFGVPNGFRLAWSLPEEQLDEALLRLSTVLTTATS
ncbi:MAG: pyridoxal phosphate-dependent aminotransferase [Myxococcales bacterium]|nr:pyridoxal phosphate-dependent aminotransferase [Myxococcales bacterium]